MRPKECGDFGSGSPREGYKTKPGDARWNPNADINGDGIANLSDPTIMADHYNQHYP